MTKQVIISLDSDDRFDENYHQKPFWMLPHDDDGWNKLEATLHADGTIYYKNMPIFTLESLTQASKCSYGAEDEAYDHYCCYVMSTEMSEKQKNDADKSAKIWFRQPIIFNSHAITNTWLMVWIFKNYEEDRIDHSEYTAGGKKTKTTCAITGTVTLKKYVNELGEVSYESSDEIE
jgi:hypothetical protein